MNRIDLQIVHPLVGILGGIIVLIWIGIMFWKPKTVSFQFAELLPKEGLSIVLKWFRLLLLVSLMLGTVILLARPQYVQRDTVTNNGIDIVLALDISYSMEANDFIPNRIVAARDVLTQFVASREADRLGLVVFAGKPFVSVPLTFDYGIIGGVLERTTTNTINQNVPGLQGTAIGDALLSSLTLLESGREELENDEPRKQVIILLTDGEANTGVDPIVVSTLAKEQGVKIYTVGIGSLEGGTIEFETAFGTRSQQIPGVDEETLKEIADITHAHYWRAKDQKTFKQIFDEIASLEKTEINQEKVFVGKDIGGRILWVMLGIIVFLLVESKIFPYTFGGKIPIRLVWLMFIMTSVALLNPGKTGKNTGGGAVMIMLDVSTSMYVEDIKYNGNKISRIVAAKTMIEKAVSNNPGSIFGLGAFAGEAVGILPLTSETNTLLSLLGSVNAGTLTKQGTSINEALQVAVDRFIGPGSGEQEKTILLITDGGEEEVLIDDSLAKRIKEEGITLVGVIVGTEQGGPIPVGGDVFGNQIFKQYQGKTVISTVNIEALAEALKTVDGTVKIVDSSRDFGIINDVISSGRSISGSTNSGLIKRLSLWILFVLTLVYCFDQTRIFSGITGNRHE